MKLKPVTLKQFLSWLKKNKHVTYVGDKSLGKSGHGRAKLIDITLDTETGGLSGVTEILVVQIKLEAKDDIQVSIWDRGSGNLLDELDVLLTEEFK